MAELLRRVWPISIFLSRIELEIKSAISFNFQNLNPCHRALSVWKGLEESKLGTRNESQELHYLRAYRVVSGVWSFEISVVWLRYKSNLLSIVGTFHLNSFCTRTWNSLSSTRFRFAALNCIYPEGKSEARGKPFMFPLALNLTFLSRLSIRCISGFPLGTRQFPFLPRVVAEDSYFQSWQSIMYTDIVKCSIILEVILTDIGSSQMDRELSTLN